jgi:hypothetical protein
MSLKYSKRIFLSKRKKIEQFVKNLNNTLREKANSDSMLKITIQEVVRDFYLYILLT